MGALSEAERGLSRGDAELAVSGLLKMEVGDRGAVLSKVSNLFQAEIAKTFSRGDWSKLAYWAARAEKEPRLMDPAPEASLWALLWGCAHTKGFARARWMFDRLQPALTQIHPQLAVAVADYLQHDGNANAQQLLALLPSPLPNAERDPRLGYEAQRPKRTLILPSDVSGVAGALRALRGVESWPAFEAQIRSWASSGTSDESARQQVVTVANRLSLRELVYRLRDQDPQPLVSVPLLVWTASQLPAPQAQPALVKAFQLVCASRPAGSIDHEAWAGAFTNLATALAKHPDCLSWVQDLTTHTPFSSRFERHALRLLEALSDRGMTPGLCFKALRLLSSSSDKGLTPGWVQRAFASALEGRGLADALLAMDRPERMRLFEAVLNLLEGKICEALIDRCWDQANDVTKRDLAELASNLVERTRSETAFRKTQRATRHRDDLDDRSFEALFASVMHRHDTGLSGPALALFERLGKRVSAFNLELLGTALEHAKSSSQASELAKAYLAHQPAVEQWVAVLREAEFARGRDLSDELMTGLIAQFRGQRLPLARGLGALEAMNAPPVHQRALAAAFLEADTPPLSQEPILERARQIARRYVRKKRGSGKPRGPAKAKPSKATARAPRRKKNDNETLPF